MPVPLSALASVRDRTVFTKKGPIVKQPLPFLTGNNLVVISPNQVRIPTASFDISFIGKTVTISGSPAARNNGVFTIGGITNSTTLALLNANLDSSDPVATLNSVIAITNNIKAEFNAHVVNGGGVIPYVHGTTDPSNMVHTQNAVDLLSVIELLNQILSNFLSHIGLTGGIPPIHLLADTDDVIYLPIVTNLPSAFYVANALRQSYESHRDSATYHYERDSVDRITVPPALVMFQSGQNIGPFSWVISNPRIAEIADSPGDVYVTVNSVEASVDAVFGLLGAIVLTNKPSPFDVVSVNYDWLPDPATQIKSLNNPAFNLNQVGNNGYTGLPGNTYRATATLVDTLNVHPIIRSPCQPQNIGWKYKMLERGYTACLNDPNTLLLNVPTNRIFYPVLDDKIFEKVIAYNPVTFPDQSTDPWILEGQGTMSLAPGGAKLTIISSNLVPGPNNSPPFYTHPIDLTFDSTVSAAFRVSILTTVPDGTFTGVAFGISDGAKTAIAGLLLTDANNLSSGISRINSIALFYSNHLVQTNVHVPNDLVDNIAVVNAVDLSSLIILANNLKTVFNQHLSNGVGYIHLLVDTADMIVTPDAVDLTSALVLVNQLFTSFNTHRVATGIHYNNDIINIVGQVQQIGFLTNSGYPEFESSWNSGAVNWSIDATYRIFRDSSGDVSLYTSGSITPTASAINSQLPAASDVDVKLDPMSQVFFGVISDESTSTSSWAFIRVNVIPIDEDQIGNNKSVNYETTVLPELDQNAPWITIGQAGFERLSSSNLVLDSTASAPIPSIASLGITTGAYRGFLRLEPILTTISTSTIEFVANVGFYTFSLDNRAAGVFIDDDIFSTWFVFLQDTPSAATVTGTAFQPFSIATNDTIILSIGVFEPITITFLFPVTTITEAATIINAAVGFPLAADNGYGFIVLTDQVLGAGSKFTLLGGQALSKLGLPIGVYFGLDSNPEPKISWFGETFPNFDTPQWTVSGSQPAEMLGRTLRITDSSTVDYLVYTVNNALYSGPVFNPLTDWKVDFRLIVQSFTPGVPVFSGNNLLFAGVLINIDEGVSGKNVELQYAVDQFGGTYINILSYNQTTGFLEQQTSFPFAWNDGNTHSIDLFTNKMAGMCIVLADNISLGNFSYINLYPGLTGPSITFGSGGSVVANADPSTSLSVVDWKSVCGFRDLKVADPTAASRRFVGIYNGGDPSLLASYYTTQVDWTIPHTYRIVRDPSSNISVFLDGGNIPVISINYSAINIPSVKNSFLQPITGNRECIAFGSFDSEEISRTVWGYVKYSIGKLTITDGLIPTHEVLNQGNVVVSPEHLLTQVPHQHAGFTVYSGGTPSDDFMVDGSIPAYTNLGEGTPPVPVTQNLESRGGLVRTATLQENVDPLQFVNENGFLTDLEDDTTNITPAIIAVDLPSSIIVLNELLSAFNDHLVQYRVHLSNNPTNSVYVLTAIDLNLAITLANTLKTNFNAHRTAVVDDSNAPAHVLNDTVNVVTAPNAVDEGTLVTLTNSLNLAYNSHLVQAGVHGNSIFIQLSPPSRVIYESAEFFQTITGEPNLVAPFSDDGATGTLTDTVTMVVTIYHV